jgi:probable O-glycosylation ligase (exosortase A-associated)
MRDILVTLVIFGLLPMIVWRAHIGAYAWAWISMMAPHKATFGFARALPFAQIVALTTLVCMLFSKDRRPFPITSVTVLQLIFVFWMSVTCLFALNRPEIVQDHWLVMLKIHLMLFATMMLIRGREQIERLVLIVTLSIGFYGVKGGVWTAITGGGGRVWGPSGGVIQGNNELGIALVLVMPFMYYLFQVTSRRLFRWALGIGIVLICLGVLGTQSRGALLALVSMATFLGLKGKHPIRTSLLLGALLFAAIIFMPDSWTQRMNTIKSYDQDGSAMSRLYTWQTLWNLALDRPFVGAGFATDNPLVFAMYAPPGGMGVYTAGGIFVAHSIYFQALGEHGFPGLILYLSLGFATWRAAGRIAVHASKDPELNMWVPLLMRMSQVSLIGFAVGGAFLTLVHFDLPYYIVCYVVLVEATLRERSQSKS